MFLVFFGSWIKYYPIADLLQTPIADKLDGIRDAAEAVHIDILVVPEHLCAGVSDEGELVLIGSLHGLHQRGEGVSAAVGRVPAAVDSVDFGDGVFDSAGIQAFVKGLAIILNRELPSIRAAEDRTGQLPLGEAVDGGLDLRGDGDDSISAGFGFGAAGESLVLPIVVGCVQLQQLGRPETEIALGYGIIGIYCGKIRPQPRFYR